MSGRLKLTGLFGCCQGRLLRLAASLSWTSSLPTRPHEPRQCLDRRLCDRYKGRAGHDQPRKSTHVYGYRGLGNSMQYSTATGTLRVAADKIYEDANMFFSCSWVQGNGSRAKCLYLVLSPHSRFSSRTGPGFSSLAWLLVLLRQDTSPGQYTRSRHGIPKRNWRRESRSSSSGCSAETRSAPCLHRGY